MTAINSTSLQPSDTIWPRSFRERLGDSAPAMMQTVGPLLSTLSNRRTALICSAKTPGKDRTGGGILDTMSRWGGGPAGPPANTPFPLIGR